MVRDQQTLGVLEELLLDEAGIPHLDFLQVAGEVGVEDDHHPVRVPHQGRPAGLEPARQRRRHSERQGSPVSS